MSTGFIGGPFFPSLFIGGTAGVAAHLIVPELPLAPAFTCLFAAIPGALVAAPFTLVLLAALATLGHFSAASFAMGPRISEPVSYTHLTLPTILLV